MKYYSEETVRRIITDTVYATLHVRKISTTEDYPCIELPDKHGRLIDEAELVRIADEICRNPLGSILEDVSTIVEATE